MTSATMNSTSSGVKATSNPSVPKVFKSPPLNIYGYAVSTWAVKKCSSARSIFNTVLLLFLNIFVQAVIVYHIAVLTNDADVPECSAIDDQFNDVLTVACVFIFAASQIGGSSFVETGQMIARAQQIQVPGASGGISYDTAADIRETSCCKRILLFLVITGTEFILWLSMLLCGTMYLVKSPNLESLILNTMALDFITHIDEHLFITMLNKATQQRVQKYKIEHPLAIDETDSTKSAVRVVFG